MVAQPQAPPGWLVYVVTGNPPRAERIDDREEMFIL